MRPTIVRLCVASVACVAQAQDTASPVTLSAGGVPALVLMVPAKTIVTPFKDKTVIHTKDMFLHIWAVGNASNVAEGVARTADVIKGDVLNFKPASTNDITIANATASEMTGPEKEADDGDEGHAQVTVFTAGGRVFVACIHGEGKLDPVEQKAMQSVLQTAKAP